MIRPSLTKTQTLILPSTNKALAEVFKTLPKEKLTQLQGAKDLSTLLSSLLKGNISDEIHNKALLDLLKTSATFKNLGDLTTSIKELVQTLKTQKIDLPIEKTLHAMLQNIKEIDPKELKHKLENSGVFLESKLKNTPNGKIKELLGDDFKAQLLQTKSHIESATIPNKAQLLQHIDKLILQIDYYQLTSYLGNNSAVFIPYDFDALESGSLTLKHSDEDHFFCDIDLTLKNYGELFIRLGLFEKKDLNINIQTQSKELQHKLQSNITELKEQLSAVGFASNKIRFLNDHTPTYGDTHHDIALGFEAKA